MKITLGAFAGYSAAIVRTEQEASCEDVRKILSWFPTTKALLGVGIAYGIERNASVMLLLQNKLLTLVIGHPVTFTIYSFHYLCH